jgi:hypothetical protein
MINRKFNFEGPVWGRGSRNQAINQLKLDNIDIIDLLKINYFPFLSVEETAEEEKLLREGTAGLTEERERGAAPDSIIPSAL